MNIILYLGFLVNILIVVFLELVSLIFVWFFENGKFIMIVEFVVSVLFYCCVFFVIFVGNVLVILVYERNWRF